MKIQIFNPQQASIVLEGLDRCGKDTLQKNILHAFRNVLFQVFHYGHFGLDPLQAHDYSEELYSDAFSMMVEAHKTTERVGAPPRSLLFNRLHFGEYVYGHIYRQYTDEGQYIFEIEKVYSEIYPEVFNKIIVITLVGDPVELIKKDDRKGFSHGDASLISKERRRFLEATERSLIPYKLVIDTTELKETETAAKAVEFIESTGLLKAAKNG